MRNGRALSGRKRGPYRQYVPAPPAPPEVSHAAVAHRPAPELGTPGSVARNTEALDDAARRAAADGARLLVCPEMFLTGYAIGDDVPRLAEAADGPAAQAVARIAARHRIAVHYGYPERDGDTLYNAAQLIGPNGTPLANYRKTHLFGGFEQRWFTPVSSRSSRRSWTASASGS